jgi:N6-L-threonylcarbamoyladenine synthase
MRAERALAQTGTDRLALGGGVAANGPLRERMKGLGAKLDIPPMELCTDNAAMIASAARYVPRLPFPDYLELDVYATGERPLTAAA